MEAEWKRIFERAPVNRRLGLELRAVHEDGATVAAPASADFEQETGVIHGGVLATLADTAAVYALMPGLAKGASMTSIEFKLNFLRAGVVGGEELVARATRVKQGRRVGLCEVDVTQGERLVARGLFTYLFTP